MPTPETSTLKKDANGNVLPQAWDATATAFMPLHGLDNALNTRTEDGKDVALGTTTDADALSGASTVKAAVGGVRAWLARHIQLLGAAIGTYGGLMAGSDGTNVQAVRVSSAAPADALTGAAGWIHAVAGKMGFNGATWDRWRNNAEGTLLASQARTEVAVSAGQTNYNARGVKVFINVTAKSDTPSIVVNIGETDFISGHSNYILASAAITDVTTYPVVLTVYPGATPVANLAVSQPLPRNWGIVVNHADADSITYSVSYSYIV
jgi:hypothetical protein